MSDFNQRELHNAELAFQGSKTFRHTQTQTLKLLRELAEAMPERMVCALLETAPWHLREWCEARQEIPVQHQRTIQFLHLLALGTTEETSLFNVACWGHFTDPKLKVFTERHTIVLAMLMEMEELAPYRMWFATRNRIPNITRKELCEIVTTLMNEGKVEVNPKNGYWRPTQIVREAYEQAVFDHDLHEAKSHTKEVEKQPVS